MGEGRDITPRLVNLILGGWMGSGLAIFILIIVDRLIHISNESSVLTLFTLNFIPQLIGGMATTFLLASRLKRNYELIGIEVGLSSFIVNLIMSFGINLYILFGYMLGGYIGALIAKRRYGSDPTVDKKKLVG